MAAIAQDNFGFAFIFPSLPFIFALQQLVVTWLKLPCIYYISEIIVIFPAHRQVGHSILLPGCVNSTVVPGHGDRALHRAAACLRAIKARPQPVNVSTQNDRIVTFGARRSNAGALSIGPGEVDRANRIHGIGLGGALIVPITLHAGKP